MIHLIHGYNVKDDGDHTIENLTLYINDSVVHKIGYIRLLNLRRKNRAIVKRLAPLVTPDDILIGHSNGALIVYRMIEAGVKPKAIVLINPALRRDTKFPSDIPVLCLHSSGDWTVQLGRMWSRLTSLGGLTPHGWGAAGRYGLTSQQKNVENFDIGESYWVQTVRSHSGIFKDPAVSYWGKFIDGWLSRVNALG
jgi:hypothetical protein